MKKLLAIVVLGFLYSSQGFAKNIYISCINEITVNDKTIVSESEYILYKKKNLHLIKNDSYNYENSNRSKKIRNQGKYNPFKGGPLTYKFDEKVWKKKNEDETSYYYGEKFIKTESGISPMSTYEFNKYTLKLSVYVHIYKNQFRENTDYTQVEAMAPLVYSCKKIKGKI